MFQSRFGFGNERAGWKRMMPTCSAVAKTNCWESKGNQEIQVWFLVLGRIVWCEVSLDKNSWKRCLLRLEPRSSTSAKPQQNRQKILDLKNLIFYICHTNLVRRKLRRIYRTQHLPDRVYFITSIDPGKHRSLEIEHSPTTTTTTTVTGKRFLILAFWTIPHTGKYVQLHKNCALRRSIKWAPNNEDVRPASRLRIQILHQEPALKKELHHSFA